MYQKYMLGCKNSGANDNQILLVIIPGMIPGIVGPLRERLLYPLFGSSCRIYGGTTRCRI